MQILVHKRAYTVFQAVLKSISKVDLHLAEAPLRKRKVEGSEKIGHKKRTKEMDLCRGKSEASLISFLCDFSIVSPGSA